MWERHWPASLTTDSSRRFAHEKLQPDGITFLRSASSSRRPCLLLRVALALPFFRSGLTKWDGFARLSDSAVWLFSEEFKLHVFGRLIAYPAPLVMAWASGIAEIVLPVLLVLGLATRWAALGPTGNDGGSSS